MSSAQALLPLEESSVLIQMFEPSVDLSTPGDLVFHETTRHAYFQPRAGHRLGLAVWSKIGPINCQLQVVRSLEGGMIIFTEKPLVDVPVAETNIPLWVSVISFEHHTAVLVPIRNEASKPSAVQHIKDKQMSPAEVMEGKEKIKNNYHLVMIDHPHRRGLPPTMNSATAAAAVNSLLAA